MIARVRAASVVAAVLVIAAPALADDEPDEHDGMTCETSAECGPLHCIDGRCRDVARVLAGERPTWGTSTGHKAMFGDGRDYRTLILALDISATLTEPFFMLATVASAAPTSSVLGVLCFVPVGFTGTLVHVAHGRYIPAVISFFAWTSLAATTFVVGGLFGLAFGRFGDFDSVAAWIAGLTFGAGGAAGLASLDSWMARPLGSPPADRTAVRFAPTFAATPGGAIAGLAGTW